MKTIFWGDNQLCRGLDIALAKQQFQLVDYWLKPNFDFVKFWDSTELSSTLAYQLMTYDRTCWHRRRMEEMELVSLNFEVENIEKSLEKRRDVAKMYDENLRGNGFNKTSVSDS